MDVKARRIARLQQLLDEHGGKKVALAKTLKKAPAQVSQWFNGVRTINEETAREIELKTKRPQGWLDTEEDGEDPIPELSLVLDEALRSMGPDARKQALDYIRYRIERSGSAIASDTLVRYDAVVEKLDIAKPPPKQ